MDVDAGNVPAPQAQAHTVPAHPQVQIINQQAVQMLQPQLTQPEVQVQTVQPQFNIVPLALHLISFGSSPAGNTITNNDINAPIPILEQITTQFTKEHITLQRLSLTLDILRDIKKYAPQMPTTTADVIMTTSSTSAQVDGKDTNLISETSYKDDIEKIGELLEQEFKDNPEELAKQKEWLKSIFKLDPSKAKEELARLENQQIALLTKMDVATENTTYTDPNPELPTEENIKNMVRCVTWIVKPRGTEKYVIAPYSTAIPIKKLHCINYLIHETDNAATKTLNVVVDNFLCEIPFEVQVPRDQKFINVVIFALPKIDKTQEQPVQSVKVALYAIENVYNKSI